MQDRPAAQGRPIVQYPTIPEYITVHLGAPDAPARNVTVTFPEYIKNVASSEIYPTWPETAIRANIYAQISYALNRVYTEWYRSRGYDFDITNTTRYDQAFVDGRDIYENIGQIVDDIFNDYVAKQGSVAPFFTQFCNGTTVTCEGLSQWGTVGLAKQGMTPYQILQNYYGNDINIIQNAPVSADIPSYGGKPLKLGDLSEDVRVIQTELNRIGKNYPAIPRIPARNGVFGLETQAAVKVFQDIFNLPQTGVVDKATWYKIKYIYTSVKKLGELYSEALTIPEVQRIFAVTLQEGSTGNQVKSLQYFLAILSRFIQDIPDVKVDGIFGPNTKDAVMAFQKREGLPANGIVDRATWNKINQVYSSVIASLPPQFTVSGAAIYPGYVLSSGMSNQDVRTIQTYLHVVAQNDPSIPPVAVTGTFDDATEAAVYAIQRKYGLRQTGAIDSLTWNRIADLYKEIQAAS